MKRICLLLVSLFLLVWCVTAGVHWATAILLSAGAVAGAGFVTFLGIRRSRQNDAGLTLSENLRKNVAPFHGFGGLGWMLIVMMTLTVFSMIPMPLGLLELFSPMSAQWYRDAWELSGADSSWGMISASFGRSAFALYHLVGFFGVYVFMTRLSGARGNILRAQKSLIVAGGILVAMLGLRFVGVGISFGAAGETAAWHIGLPVNSNHLSGVLAALSLISLGSVLLKRHHDDLA